MSLQRGGLRVQSDTPYNCQSLEPYVLQLGARDGPSQEQLGLAHAYWRRMNSYSGMKTGH